MKSLLDQLFRKVVQTRQQFWLPSSFEMERRLSCVFLPVHLTCHVQQRTFQGPVWWKSSFDRDRRSMFFAYRHSCFPRDGQINLWTSFVGFITPLHDWDLQQPGPALHYAALKFILGQSMKSELYCRLFYYYKPDLDECSQKHLCTKWKDILCHTRHRYRINSFSLLKVNVDTDRQIIHMLIGTWRGINSICFFH